MTKIVRTPTKATGGITDAERDEMKKHADLWISRAMRTTPVDVDEITSAVHDLYAAAGLTNGRRVSDDVTDIAMRVVAGVLRPPFNVFPNNRLGDGVNTNDVPYQETFPYVAFANSGRDSRHQGPGHLGCVAPTSPFVSVTCPTN